MFGGLRDPGGLRAAGYAEALSTRLKRYRLTHRLSSGLQHTEFLSKTLHASLFFLIQGVSRL